MQLLIPPYFQGHENRHTRTFKFGRAVRPRKRNALFDCLIFLAYVRFRWHGAWSDTAPSQRCRGTQNVSNNAAQYKSGLRPQSAAELAQLYS